MINDVYKLNITIISVDAELVTDKTISSIHDNLFEIQNLFEQITEMHYYAFLLYI